MPGRQTRPANPLENNFDNPHPHISKKNGPKICHKMRGRMAQKSLAIIKIGQSSLRGGHQRSESGQNPSPLRPPRLTSKHASLLWSVTDEEKVLYGGTTQLATKFGPPLPCSYICELGSIWQESVGISPAIYRARNPETVEKFQKSLSRGVWDPRPRTPKKFKKKSPKSPKKSQNQLVFGLFRPFSELFGGSGRGVPNSSRETFLRLSGVSGFRAL